VNASIRQCEARTGMAEECPAGSRKANPIIIDVDRFMAVVCTPDDTVTAIASARITRERRSQTSKRWRGSSGAYFDRHIGRSRDLNIL